jgi:hypothetical protein
MAGFAFRKNLDGCSAVPTLIRAIGKNSVIFTVGDVVRINTSGNFDLSTTTEQLFGVVQTVVDKNGLPVTPDTGSTNTWTMSGTNDSVNLYEVAVIPAFGHYAFSCDSDTTIEAASLGKYFALNSTSDGVVTSGESATLGALDCQLIGIDPNDNADVSMGLYRFVNTQVAQLTLSDQDA